MSTQRIAVSVGEGLAPPVKQSVFQNDERMTSFGPPIIKEITKQ